MSPPLVRVSYLPMYPDCSRRSAARMFPELVKSAGFQLRELPPGIGAATGTATHTAVSTALKVSLHQGVLGDEEESIDAAMVSLHEEIDGGVMWDGISPDLNTAEKQVIRQNKVWRSRVGETIQPIMVEERLEANWGGFVVSGQSDHVAYDQEAQRTGARNATGHDLKTGAVLRSAAAQYGGYSRLIRSHGISITRFVEDYVKRTRISDPQPDPLEIEYDIAKSEAITEAILRRIQSDYNAFAETGDPLSFLANPGSMLCSDRWCTAWGTKFCTEHVKTQQAVTPDWAFD